MKILSIIVALFTITQFSYAGEIACTAQITLLMADHPSCTDNNGEKQLAFMLAGSDVWICNNSDTASSLVLAAKMSEKSITVYMSDTGGATCQSHTQYIKPSYTYIQ
jgi:hypothetical protein